MKIKTLILIGTLLVSPLAFSEQGSIEVKSEAFKIIEVVDKKGNKKIEYIKLGEKGALPKDTIIYINTFKNVGTEDADDIVITNPIAEKLSYIKGSAKGKATEINFSVNKGKSFHDPANLTIIDKNGKKKIAQAKDYNAIQWIYLPKLKPGQESTVNFKAILGKER